jgi:hypothetical protein
MKEPVMADENKLKQATLDKTSADELAAEEAAAKEMANKQGKGRGILIVSGPEAGRRRVGMIFGKEPVEVDIAGLTKEQIDAINADPQLSVKRK